MVTHTRDNIIKESFGIEFCSNLEDSKIQYNLLTCTLRIHHYIGIDKGRTMLRGAEKA
jgi:hypothetical protein